MFLWIKYGKSITAVAILIITAVQAALSDSDTAGRISQIEIVQIAIAACTALTVYLAPNLPQYPWVKTGLAVVLALLQLAISLIVDGIGSADWAAAILAIITAITIGVAPARSDTAPSHAAVREDLA